MRGIVSRGFTPRAIGNLRQVLTERAERIVATALDVRHRRLRRRRGVRAAAAGHRDLIGVPQEDRGKIFAWSNRMIGYDDELPGEENAGEMAAIEILGYSMAMAEERRGCPRDDIVTKLISAEIDGHGLSDDEFGYFVLMLAVAGNETTRNAITHGMLAFLDHPEQWELFKAPRPDTAADEIVRWATPMTVFQRTATRRRRARRPADQGGRPAGPVLPVGQLRRGGLRPARSGSTSARSPNPHLGFGGLGTHYCLGASLAKLEIDLIFNAIADAMPDIAKAGDPVRLRSGWINGIKSLPVSLPADRSAGRAGDHPHGEELGAAAVGVPQGDARPGHLVRAGLAHDLQRRLGKSQQPRSADRVGAEHAAGRVDRQPAPDRGLARLGQPPAFPGRGEAEVLQPHRLVPGERHVDLGHVDLVQRVGDAGLPPQRRRARPGPRPG